MPPPGDGNMPAEHGKWELAREPVGQTGQNCPSKEVAADRDFPNGNRCAAIVFPTLLFWGGGESFPRVGKRWVTENRGKLSFGAHSWGLAGCHLAAGASLWPRVSSGSVLPCASSGGYTTSPGSPPKLPAATLAPLGADECALVGGCCCRGAGPAGSPHHSGQTPCPDLHRSSAGQGHCLGLHLPLPPPSACHRFLPHPGPLQQQPAKPRGGGQGEEPLW